MYATLPNNNKKSTILHFKGEKKGLLSVPSLL